MDTGPPENALVLKMSKQINLSTLLLIKDSVIIERIISNLGNRIRNKFSYFDDLKACFIGHKSN